MVLMVYSYNDGVNRVGQAGHWLSQHIIRHTRKSKDLDGTLGGINACLEACHTGPNNKQSCSGRANIDSVSRIGEVVADLASLPSHEGVINLDRHVKSWILFAGRTPQCQEFVYSSGFFVRTKFGQLNSEIPRSNGIHTRWYKDRTV
jgi:hypothetical protein